ASDSRHAATSRLAALKRRLMVTTLSYVHLQPSPEDLQPGRHLLQPRAAGVGDARGLKLQGLKTVQAAEMFEAGVGDVGPREDQESQRGYAGQVGQARVGDA